MNRQRTMRTLTLLCGLWAAGTLAGCASGVNYDNFKSENPDVRIETIRDARGASDEESIPYLVDLLEDTESHVRFFAFGALKHITGGRTMGWHYSESSVERKADVVRWRKWLDANQPEGWGDIPPETTTKPAPPSKK